MFDLYLFFIKTAKKLVGEPPMTVDLSLTPLPIDFSSSHRDTLTISTRRLKNAKNLWKIREARLPTETAASYCQNP